MSHAKVNPLRLLLDKERVPVIALFGVTSLYCSVSPIVTSPEDSGSVQSGKDRLPITVLYYNSNRTGRNESEGEYTDNEPFPESLPGMLGSSIADKKK